MHMRRSVALATLIWKVPLPSRSTIPGGAETNELGPRFNGTASRYMTSFLGAPFAVTMIVATDSGSIVRPSWTKTFQGPCEASCFPLVTAREAFFPNSLSGVEGAENKYASDGARTAGIRCGELLTCQKFPFLLRIVCSCQALCVSSPIS